MRVLVDTNVIIEHLHGATRVTPYFDAAADGTIELSISVMTEYELLRWPLLTDDDADEIGFLLERYRVIDVDRRIAQIAATISRTHTRIGTADILIAATAIAHHVPLLTKNVRHFKNVAMLELLTEPPKV
ncbi:MAG: type II toxin-antitoxin system VapC family toxin [Candidatus Uhrbacteria bacterium]